MGQASLRKAAAHHGAGKTDAGNQDGERCVNPIFSEDGGAVHAYVMSDQQTTAFQQRQERIAAQTASGQSIAAYCREHGLWAGQLYE